MQKCRALTAEKDVYKRQGYRSVGPRCSSVETCCKAAVEPPHARPSARRRGGQGCNDMAEVVLKNIKKVYPNLEPKKGKKAEGEHKHNLKVTEEGVLAVQDFNLDIQDLSLIHI